MPVIFAAHGAPPLLEDAGWASEFRTWAKGMPKPKAVLMVSAHWESRPLMIGATTTVPLYYDYYNFPQRFYEVKYPSPGAPQLAAQVRELLRAKEMPFEDNPERGLDHGAFVPMICMYPEADVPTLQVSLPSLDMAELFKLGQALAPLRREGVLIFGSGFLTHNMRIGRVRATPVWAEEFDAWVADAITRHDADDLIHFMKRAPGAEQALPTTEHYAPVVVAAGAVADERPAVKFPINGFRGGAMTRRSVQYG